MHRKSETIYIYISGAAAKKKKKKRNETKRNEKKRKNRVMLVFFDVQKIMVLLKLKSEKKNFLPTRLLSFYG